MSNKNEYIENANKIQPGELVIDAESGTFYVKGSDGKLHPKAADTMAKLQELDDAGILRKPLEYNLRG